MNFRYEQLLTLQYEGQFYYHKLTVKEKGILTLMVEKFTYQGHRSISSRSFSFGNLQSAVQSKGLYKLSSKALKTRLQLSLLKLENFGFVTINNELMTIATNTVYIFRHAILLPYFGRLNKEADHKLMACLDHNFTTQNYDNVDFDEFRNFSQTESLACKHKLITALSKSKSVAKTFFNIVDIMLSNEGYTLKQFHILKNFNFKGLNDIEFGFGEYVYVEFEESLLNQDQLDSIQQLYQFKESLHLKNTPSTIRFYDTHTVHQLYYRVTTDSFSIKSYHKNIIFTEDRPVEVKGKRTYNGTLHANHRVCRLFTEGSTRYFSPKNAYSFANKFKTEIIRELYALYLHKENDFLLNDPYSVLTHIPITFAKLKSIHNKRQLAYKISGNVISKKMSKLPVHILLAFAEVLPSIRREDYDIFVNWVCKLDTLPSSFSTQNLLVAFLFHENGIYQELAEDYVNLCQRLDLVVNLRIKSNKRLNDEHIKLSRLIDTEEIQVHKDFNELGLPFELIDTKDKLLEEARRQRHCVNSYDMSINSGQCAIYTFIHDNQRYTLEIQRRGKLFNVGELKGFANSIPPTPVQKLVKKEFQKALRKVDKIIDDHIRNIQ